MYSKVENYIFFALKEYRQINLPGFGVLEIQSKKAEVHPVHHAYEAPAEFIQFSPNASHGKDLAKYLSKDADLDLNTAEKIISDFFLEFSKKLSTLNKAEIKGVGVFFEKGKTIHFQAEANTELIPHSYGLFNFKAGTPKKETIVTAPKIEKKKKRKVPAIIFILVFLGAAITSAFFVFPKKSNEIWNKAIAVFNKEETQNQVADQENSDSTITETSKVIVSDTIATDTIKIDSSEIEVIQKNNTQITENNNAPSGTRYFVVANSFSMKEFADDYVNKLKNKNYPARIIGVNSSGLNIVSYNEGFATKEQARQYMQEIQIKEGRNDLWIHCQNCN